MTSLDEYESNPNADFRVKETLMYVLGNLRDFLSKSVGLGLKGEDLLMKYIFKDLSSENFYLKERAVWLYGKYAKLDL